MMSERANAFTRSFRTLWGEYAVMIRQSIGAERGGSADLRQLSPRLDSKAEEIGNAVAPFYGTETANALTNLLKQREHLDARAIAELLKQPKLSPALNDFVAAERRHDDLNAILSQAFAVSDAISMDLEMRFPDRF